MATRRLLVPAATSAAVLVIAAGGFVIARDSRGVSKPSSAVSAGSPTLPPLVIGAAGGTGDAVMAAAAPAPETAGKVGAPAPGSGQQRVTIKGELTAAPDKPVPAYKVPRKKVTAADVEKLAKALGIEGKAKQESGGWVVAGDGRYVAVDPSITSDWRMGPGDATCAYGGGGSVPSAGSTGAAAPGGDVAGVVAATPAGPDSPVSDRPADAKPADPAQPAEEAAKRQPAEKPVPQPDPAGKVAPENRCGFGVATTVSCAPPDAQTLVACPTPEAKPLPTVDVARSAVVKLLPKLGIEAEVADIRVEEGYDGVRHVSVRRRIGGLAADGMYSSFGVDAAGKLVTASGQLAEPVVAGEYPMLPPAELAQGLSATRMIAMICEQKPGVEGCAPPPPLVVTGASVGLSLAYPADYEKGEAYLLPAWHFTIEGDPVPSAVVAVPDKYRSDVGAPQPGTDGTTEPAPLPPTTVVDPVPPAIDPSIEPAPRPAVTADPGATGGRSTGLRSSPRAISAAAVPTLATDAAAEPTPVYVVYATLPSDESSACVNGPAVDSAFMAASDPPASLAVYLRPGASADDAKVIASCLAGKAETVEVREPATSK